jgi:ABC-type branched-subunit amino acid transport system permease subunit
LNLNNPLVIGSFKLHFYANYFVLFLILMILAMIVVHRIYNSPVGLTLNAIRDDAWAARTAGVNLVSWKLIGFCTGSALIGIAGSGYAHMVGYIAPDDFAFPQSLFMMSMVLLGGTDSIPGVSVAALILVVVTEKLRIVQEYRFLIYGLLVVATMIFRPKGLIPATIRPYFKSLRSRIDESLPAGWKGGKAS